MPIEPGTRIGAYEVRQPIGRGAMGIVYEAYHRALDRRAAVKVLQALAPELDATARFRREAQSIAQMRHPNVLQVFDFGDYEGVPYMVVEYVPGGSLADRLKAGTPAPEEAIAILRGLASALDYAHRLGIVHRDVKPGNVLMHADGTPVLADFGLAKLLQSASIKSQTGVTTGTPAYMAPEQVTGSAVGPAADRYALAAVAYELLTGTTPFRGEGVLELLYAHVHREPDPPSARRPGLPPAVDAVLLKGLAKAPEARWESCGAMVDALAAALQAPAPVTAGAAVPAAAVAATQVIPSPAHAPVSRRRRWAVIAAGVVVLLLLAVVGLTALRQRGVQVAASPASAARGDLVTVSGSGLPPNQRGSVAVDGARVDAFTANGSGAVSVTFRVPAATRTGQHRIQLCWNAVCHGDATVDVR